MTHGTAFRYRVVPLAVVLSLRFDHFEQKDRLCTLTATCFSKLYGDNTHQHSYIGVSSIPKSGGKLRCTVLGILVVQGSGDLSHSALERLCCPLLALVERFSIFGRVCQLQASGGTEMRRGSHLLPLCHYVTKPTLGLQISICPVSEWMACS